MAAPQEPASGAALSDEELSSEAAALLPPREALSLISPSPGGADGVALAMEQTPDGSGGEGAIGDHAPIYTIQPIEPNHSAVESA